MTRYATILLLAAAATAQFAGDAAAGSKPRDIATRPTNWLAQAHKKSAGAPKRKRWKKRVHIPPTDPRSPFYVDPNAPVDEEPEEKLSPKTKRGVKAIFDVFDTRKEGMLSTVTLGAAFHKLGVAYKPELVKLAMDEFDLDGSDVAGEA